MMQLTSNAAEWVACEPSEPTRWVSFRTEKEPAVKAQETILQHDFSSPRQSWLNNTLSQIPSGALNDSKPGRSHLGAITLPQEWGYTSPHSHFNSPRTGSSYENQYIG